MKNPFTQASELIKLQKEAKTMQNKLKATLVTGESRDLLVKITINGTQELEDVVISESLLNPDSQKNLVKDIKQAYQSAQKDLQREMMKDFDFSKIKSMLG